GDPMAMPVLMPPVLIGQRADEQLPLLDEEFRFHLAFNVFDPLANTPGEADLDDMRVAFDASKVQMANVPSLHRANGEPVWHDWRRPSIGVCYGAVKIHVAEHEEIRLHPSMINAQDAGDDRHGSHVHAPAVLLMLIRRAIEAIFPSLPR